VASFTARLFYSKERWFGRGFSLGSGEDKILDSAGNRSWISRSSSP